MPCMYECVNASMHVCIYACPVYMNEYMYVCMYACDVWMYVRMYASILLWYSRVMSHYVRNFCCCYFLFEEVGTNANH